MEQFAMNPRIYRNSLTGFDFYHDFDAYTSLRNQWTVVSSKYERRISRFLDSITEPTLFIRYISSDKDAEYVNGNQGNINQTLQAYCRDNKIIYIQDINNSIKIPSSFHVVRDQGDTVCRAPVAACQELQAYLESGVVSDQVRKLNMDTRARFISAQGGLPLLVRRVWKKVQKSICQPVVHERICSDQ